jgi:hypothetical protein
MLSLTDPTGPLNSGDFKADHKISQISEDKPYPRLIFDQRNPVGSPSQEGYCSTGHLHKVFYLCFEVLSNRIYPMPGMKEVIHSRQFL